MRDETHFLLSGHDNKQDSRFWRIQNLQLINETSLHPLKTTAWCAPNVAGCREKFLKRTEIFIANRGHHLADIIFQS
ncbi:hypothetical protein GWI33_019406 [Rhynchophorus ferrugineus]|uniref:Uncharacterized protein n=1 Tax=Rhynchophorus ferrugineus TaxID=354439 RepID=A0A834HTR6_RHYFE|nr:hypothetical protein GWI33_019406 [Rhynchophorus ferrugineus]